MIPECYFTSVERNTICPNLSFPGDTIGLFSGGTIVTRLVHGVVSLTCSESERRKDTKERAKTKHEDEGDGRRRGYWELR